MKKITILFLLILHPFLCKGDENPNYKKMLLQFYMNQVKLIQTINISEYETYSKSLLPTKKEFKIIFPGSINLRDKWIKRQQKLLELTLKKLDQKALNKHFSTIKDITVFERDVGQFDKLKEKGFVNNNIFIGYATATSNGKQKGFEPFAYLNKRWVLFPNISISKFERNRKKVKQ